MIKRYFIDLERMSVDYVYTGRWRFYELTALGNNADEMLEAARIYEVDQSGVEIRNYSVHDAPYEVWQCACTMIRDCVNRGRAA